MGMSFHTPRPPTDVNCPRDVSRKKRGIPANTSVMKYGIRKAPAHGTKQTHVCHHDTVRLDLMIHLLLTFNLRFKLVPVVKLSGLERNLPSVRG